MSDDMIIVRIGTGRTGKTSDIYINKKISVKELFQELRRRGMVDGNRDFYLVLDGNNAIGEFKPGNLESNGFYNCCTVHTILCAVGGGDLAEWLSASQNNTSFYSGGVYRKEDSVGVDHGIGDVNCGTFIETERCCIMGDDDTSDERVGMPCGCVIGTGILKEYCERNVKEGTFNFPCVRCDSVWPNSFVSGAMSAYTIEEEHEILREKLNQDYLNGSSGFHVCPFCNTYIKRDPSKKIISSNRIECAVCTKKDGRNVAFCVGCGKAWIGDRKSCEDPGCAQIKILESCPTKRIYFVTGIPKVRRCVECGRLIQHMGGCKHMKCLCEREFCFVCLKERVKVEGEMKWQCGGAYSVCPVAPRQTTEITKPDQPEFSPPSAPEPTSKNPGCCTVS